ncbi:MAG: TAXI family TRAP transporter solute-binding subunit [Alphaproteobacteria bacterium]|nr:TAXI family TRAP transporter solute-binding subunit [Alphaproteobacteria bacterium]
MKPVIRLLAVAATAGAMALGAGAASAQTIRLMTGPQGGVWVPLGAAMKNLWETGMPGVTVQTLPGAGIANVRGVDEGRTEWGFGNSISTVDGINGAEPFPRRTQNVCNIATLYPQYFQVVALADSGINTVRDLRGRSIAVQTRGNTAEVATRQMLQVVGLSYNDLRVNFQASYTDAVSLMKDGHAQVFTLGTTIPASSIMDLATSRPVRILDLAEIVDGMRRINPGYVGVPLPANTYPGQAQAVTQVGYMTHLIAACNQPEDRIYAMTRILAQNLPALQAIVRDMQGLTPRQMAQDIGVPLHPGAQRFYREAGAIN